VIFGSCESCLWNIKEFQELLLKEDWNKLSKFKNTFSNSTIRTCNFHMSGCEVAEHFLTDKM